ncbi:TonB-dependent hemoglobin/transferrin/lactoferrin family receptor [Parvibaculum sp.]|uniref:TonB-dependent hemoglobin/transferrin/lactoferrin family receptor n=1 Tax=Parvibaculum sp. TaxID=2024848 RepID=UPI0025F8F206|nr:TonB-dependent hemoglobin/transferrin/lactoferrin family receptor [Parvibaculum sp.]|tara:strand:- start:40 stop:2400 length:2361 start_codon:yes stop_codon:yes gene_type:complete
MSSSTISRRFTPGLIAGTAAALALTFAALGGSAYAQETSSEKESEASSTSGGNEKDVEEESANAYVFSPVTVTANRAARSLLETPGNVSRITAEQLDRRMDNTVKELFRYEPGISVSRQVSAADPFDSAGGIQIRGVGGNRTQVIVDGSRTIEGITDNTRDIVDTSNMKAVEIVRGPSSVLWGSDGLGGVVNFVTKDPADYFRSPDDMVAGSASASYSSLDNAYVESVTGAFRLSEAPNAVEALLTVTRRDANEPQLRTARNESTPGNPTCPRDPLATPCNELDPQDIASNNVLTKFVWSPSEGNQFRLTGEYYTRRTDVDQNAANETTATYVQTGYRRRQDVERWRVSLDQQWDVGAVWLDTLDWQLTWSPQNVDRTGDRRRTLLPSGDLEQRLDSLKYSETFYEADIQFGSSVSIGGISNTLTYGFDGDYVETEYERVDITNNLTANTTTVAVAGGFNFANADTTRADVYLQDEISLFDDRLTLVPGLRNSYYKITPHPDANYQIVPGAEPREKEESDLQFKFGSILDVWGPYSVYASYAEGFKMPTAQQLYQSLNSLPFFALVPNPNLRPESVKSYEAGLRGAFSRGFFSLNYFQADYTDFIQNFVSVAGSATDLTYDNLSSVNVWGVEASGAVQFSPNWRANFSASHMRGTQQASPGAPETNFNGALPLNVVLGLNYVEPAHGLDIELVTTLQKATTRVTDPATDFAPSGYVTFDLLASWEFMPGVTLKAAGYNLLDQRYFPADTAGFPIGADATLAVQVLNPIEQQVGFGRFVKVGLELTF